MFRSKRFVVVGIIILLIANIAALAMFNKRQVTSVYSGHVAIASIVPFHEITYHGIDFFRDMWRYYFFLASVAQENELLQQKIRGLKSLEVECEELKLANSRLRHLLDFKEHQGYQMIAAQVIGKDSSTWFKSITIDKGKSNGIAKGMPVIASEGIVGLILESSHHYSKVMLLTDSNSAIDGFIQRTRSRGIVKGISLKQPIFKYTLSNEDIIVGDKIMSSGMDNVYPKGFPIGTVADITKIDSEIFQEIRLDPAVEFNRLEEIFVVTQSFTNPEENDQNE